MFASLVALFSVIWGVWFAFLVRHPKEWQIFVEFEHRHLSRMDISTDWMKRLETGAFLRVVVGLTSFAGMVCFALLMNQG